MTAVEVAWLDRDGRILGTNDAWRDFGLAHSADERTCGVGASYLDVCDAAGDDLSRRVGEAIRTACAGGDAFPTTITIPCPIEHGTAWFDLTVVPRVDDDGSPLGAMVSLRPVDLPGDGGSGIDARSVWDLVEHAPDGLVVVDESGIITYANVRMEVLSGHGRDDLLGRPLELLVPEALRRRHRQHRASFRWGTDRREMGRGIDLELRRRDGTTCPVEVSLSPVLIGGAVMVAASVRDVGTRRDEDRARRRLLALLDLVPDAVYVVDAETTRIEYANEGAVGMLGRLRAELTSMTLLDLSPDATEDSRRELLHEHAQAGEGHLHHEHVCRTAGDGSLVPCDSRGAVVLNEDEGDKVVIVDRDARPRLAAEHLRERSRALALLIAEVTAMVLSDSPAPALHQRVVEGAATLLDSENASLVRRLGPGSHETLAAWGPAATLHLTGAVRLDAATLDAWMQSDAAVALDGPPAAMPTRLRTLVGPGVVAPCTGPDDTRAVLTAFRAAGREPFDADELGLLTDLARQLSTVLALGRARAAQHRLALLGDRQRIARDLHDTVIQDVISIGMQIGATPDLSAEVREALLDRVDDVVRHLRTIVFDTRVPTDTASPSDAVRATLAESSRSLGHEPTLTLSGPLDELEPVAVAHLVPCLREALSNVARHARARSTTVSVTVDDEAVELVVEDDGIGLRTLDGAGTGLANLAERAALLGGRADVGSRPGGGTCVRWTARRPRSVAPSEPSQA